MPNKHMSLVWQKPPTVLSYFMQKKKKVGGASFEVKIKQIPEQEKVQKKASSFFHFPQTDELCRKPKRDAKRRESISIAITANCKVLR